MLGAPFDATTSRRNGTTGDDAESGRTQTNSDGNHRRGAPGARCGHTLTALRWNQRTKIVAFGGATELEGGHGDGGGGANNASPNATSSGGAWVKLSGATNELHVLDPQIGEWSALMCGGDVPSPRAAHGAATVGGMLVVHGGIGPDGLAD